MPTFLRPAASLVLLLALACGSKGPSYAYDTSAGLGSARTFALDPRQLIFRVDGRREVDAGTFRTAAIQEFKAKGFTQAGADAADVWVQVIVLADNVDRDNAPARKHEGDSEGRSRGRGAKAPDAAPARHTVPTGDVSVVVKVLSREGLKTLWYGRAELPGQKPGEVPQEDHVHTLMAPLPPRD